MVQSVPGELSMDHSAILQQAEKNQAFVSVSYLRRELHWEGERSQKALDHMVNQGLAWLDLQNPQEKLYYFPSLFTACVNASS